MDLRALMQKLETINTTHTLTESVEERVVITESVAAPLVQEDTFKSSIARSLIEEFGYDLDEADAPLDPNKGDETTKQTAAMVAKRAADEAKSGKAVGSGTTPPPEAAPTAAPGAAPAAGTAAPADNRNIFQKAVGGIADFHKKNSEIN